jgi:predicted amidohydrolase YtcJ
VAVGTRFENQAPAGSLPRVVDARGLTPLPGFVESHLHLVLGGNEFSQKQLGVMRGIRAALTCQACPGCHVERVGLMDALRAETAGGA